MKTSLFAWSPLCGDNRFSPRAIFAQHFNFTQIVTFKELPEGYRDGDVVSSITAKRKPSHPGAGRLGFLLAEAGTIVGGTPNFHFEPITGG
jgi:hypothetical protein